MTVKNVLTAFIVVAFSGMLQSAHAQSGVSEGVKWYTWEEAMALQQQKPRKIFVDVYTDWCGWCKKMDKSTFVDPGVAKVLNRDFYAVKFNAEQKADVAYGGSIFKFVANGSRGYHELAATMLDGKLGYPSFVYFNEKTERILISPGYKEADMMGRELRFVTEEHYKNDSWENWIQKN
jgi:thioredoxin-related protein